MAPASPAARFRPALLWALLLLAVTSAVPAPVVHGQGGDPGRRPGEPSAGILRSDQGERMTLHAYTLRHRRAEEAAERVRDLLSPRGTVTVQAEANTLVVRDTVASLLRIVPVLRELDRPARGLELEVLVVRAYRSRVSIPPSARPPEELTSKLRKLLNYGSYQLVAEARLPTREGEEVTYQVGDTYSVGFRVGDLAADGNVKLHDFRLFRQAADEPLIRTNLILFLDKTYSLGFSKSEESETALMVVITCRRPADEAPAGARRN